MTSDVARTAGKLGPADEGPVVHVGGPGRECAIGLLIARGDRLSRVRIFRSSFARLVGTADEEGDVRHWTDAQWVPTPHPDPSEHVDWRMLDSWHEPKLCASVCYPPEPPDA